MLVPGTIKCLHKYYSSSDRRGVQRENVNKRRTEMYPDLGKFGNTSAD